MTHRALGILSLVALAACSGEPSGPSTTTQPNFAISDAIHSGGNPNFFWRPPIANSGSGSGTFNAGLNVLVKICAFTTTPPLNCSGPALVATFPSVPVVSGQYQTTWAVPVSSQTLYRIIVVLADLDSTVIGFADVHTAATKNLLKNVDPNQFVPITDGSNLPIKFRIETNCTGTCNSESFVNLENGGSAFWTVGTVVKGGVTIPPQPGDDRIITFRFSGCGDLPIANPLFGSCMRIETTPELVGAGALSVAGAAFICDAGGAVGDLPEGQGELVTLHRKHGTDPIQALPHADDECPVIVTSIGGVFRALAHGDFRTAGKQLFGLIAPQPLYARRLDAGAGGLTSEFSDFQFALPAKMTEYSPPIVVDATSIYVIVTDLQGTPVENAKISFAPATLGPNGVVTPTLVLTGPSGIASSSWTLPAGFGTFTATASGLGIAAGACGDGCTEFVGGPRSSFDPFQPESDHFDDCGTECNEAPVNLQTGIITFSQTISPGPSLQGSIQRFPVPSTGKGTEKSGVRKVGSNK